ncbi:hypothetical protein LRP52_41030 [Photobacterium sp. ZSDE20]|uniref:Uncharacterized protein n=1 Tax=Photobacterium pectinilyticum TaxID=2906793 RepID=A0ABT1N9L1_9GAMM|nr:hypothetical protein [Photobacterium sp. ZSDE20]MCQ1060807.1 hypothetical protein [Photobacterium sp. ZSDE20]MDD1828569.1 hypothetical protein [Photobacterium sp. ZSDE20]
MTQSFIVNELSRQLKSHRQRLAMLKLVKFAEQDSSDDVKLLELETLITEQEIKVTKKEKQIAQIQALLDVIPRVLKVLTFLAVLVTVFYMAAKFLCL